MARDSARNSGSRAAKGSSRSKSDNQHSGDENKTEKKSKKVILSALGIVRGKVMSEKKNLKEPYQILSKIGESEKRNEEQLLEESRSFPSSQYYNNSEVEESKEILTECSSKDTSCKGGVF